MYLSKVTHFCFTKITNNFWMTTLHLISYANVKIRFNVRKCALFLKRKNILHSHGRHSQLCCIPVYYWHNPVYEFPHGSYDTGHRSVSGEFNWLPMATEGRTRPSAGCSTRCIKAQPFTRLHLHTEVAPTTSRKGNTCPLHINTGKHNVSTKTMKWYSNMSKIQSKWCQTWLCC